jgi:hypothetical protein
MPRLAQCCPDSLVVAYKCDTSPLEESLKQEGFAVQLISSEYSKKELEYSASVRCLMAHATAWRLAANRKAPSLVIEGDFVPAIGFGQMPVPVPEGRIHNSIGYLYACAPQIWDIEDRKYARGHAGATVALIIPPKVAAALLEFYDEQMAKNPLGQYVPWDAGVGYWLKERGFQSYMPYRQYGEHGGIPNPEHQLAGLSRQHRADVIHGDLHFMPEYAGASRFAYNKTRLWARYWGIVRLLVGRTLAFHDLRRSRKREMLRFVIGRQFFSALPN